MDALILDPRTGLGHMRRPRERRRRDDMIGSGNQPENRKRKRSALA
ncbi:hypothetical protein [Burkholderia vietnamiensis]|nr:hypothetical protein [Burkholderia vietnamiensis]